MRSSLFLRVDHRFASGLVYNPNGKAGKRLSANMPTSKIPRMYHSVATMTGTSLGITFRKSTFSLNWLSSFWRDSGRSLCTIAMQDPDLPLPPDFWIQVMSSPLKSTSASNPNILFSPNADVSTAVYRTEYSIEMLNPPVRLPSQSECHDFCSLKI